MFVQFLFSLQREMKNEMHSVITEEVASIDQCSDRSLN